MIKELIKLIFITPEYYVLFWNSMKVVFAIILGQVCFAVPCAWGLSQMKNKVGSVLFVLYIICMILPFQCTMLAQYMVINELHILDTHWSLILPLVFSTFPVFILYDTFYKLEDEMIEAARLDGAGEFQIFLHIGVPLAVKSIAASAALGFFEYWNMVEQPILFITTKTKMVLSEFVPFSNGRDQAAVAFAIMSIVPAVIIVASCRELIDYMGEDEIEKGNS